MPLDTDGRPSARAVPVDLPPGVGTVGHGVVRRPVVPPGLRAGNLKLTVRHAAGNAAHTAAFHAVRLPWYALTTVRYAAVGVHRIARVQARWWWVSEAADLRERAAGPDPDAGQWLRLHGEIRATRRRRGMLLALEVTALLVGLRYTPTV
nr:hypothetical protein [Micromonospora sp. DSM 115978]